MMKDGPHHNLTPADDSFKEATPKVGRMYHIKGMYRGTFFRLIDIGKTHATLEYPNRRSNKLFAAKISDLKEIRGR